MKCLIPILLLLIGCGTNPIVFDPKDSIIIIIPPNDSIIIPGIDSAVSEANKVILYTDTLFKTKVFYTDTLFKTRTIWTDTLYKTRKIIVPVPIDSPYYVPRPIDSAYTVPRPVDSPYCNCDTAIVPPIDTTTYTGTLFGVLLATEGEQSEKLRLTDAELKTIRIPIYFYRDAYNIKIDNFLNAGYNVQINFNWKPTSTPVTFPKPSDLTDVRNKAETFFKYYQKWVKQIPVVCVENEWDNDHYRDWNNTTIEDYIEELKVVVEVGHKYGFEISDAGFTGNSLGRWTYSQLPTDEAKWWISKYFVGTSADNYQPLLQLVAKYTSLIKTVPIDYLNVHWYNIRDCPQGFKRAVELYKTACGKTSVINNEFGLRVNSVEVWKCTVQEMKDAGMIIAIAYSGVNQPGQAIYLTDEMLSLMK